MTALVPGFDVDNLVRELAENKVLSLEILREAISNAKDHEAANVWIKTSRDPRNNVSILLIDDGTGMDDAQLKAFWGLGVSIKRASAPIGYKGHGTKLYFVGKSLEVATRAAGDASWRNMKRVDPAHNARREIEVATLREEDPLAAEVRALGLVHKTGTAIRIDGIEAADSAGLLNRRTIESYCDWFTAIGDVRSGLFDKRKEFHDAIAAHSPVLESLRTNEVALRPLSVHLQVNGERLAPIGLGNTAPDKAFLAAWHDDVQAHGSNPALLAFGHRFADKLESGAGAHRVRDDLTALRLTGPEDWVTEDGIAIVIRVEGHRRQRETYQEGSWQNHAGTYKFEDRFGLWLCRDFIPISQRNDLLKQALDRASNERLRFDFNSLRNWQTFVNVQRFLPTANRNSISNLQGDLESRVVETLVEIFSKALKRKEFLDWVMRLRTARAEKRKEQELQYMDERREAVVAWLAQRGQKDVIDPMNVAGLRQLDEDVSMPIRSPRNEQELFYLYGMLSARYEMPIQIEEYDTHQAIDAIGVVRRQDLVSPRAAHARVEFKYDVSAGNPIDHFFDAIDVVICWRVGGSGVVYEESSAGDTVGKLQKRAKPVLKPALDTHEIVYDRPGAPARVVPILQISALFPEQSRRRRASG